MSVPSMDFIDIDFEDESDLSYWQRFVIWFDSLNLIQRGHRFLLWFLEVATIKVTFEDVIFFMTLFVLFGDSIKVMTTSKDYDYPFTVMNTICLFFFIVEFFMATIAKSTITLSPKVAYTGYIFSFFWVLDLASIISMFPDISWIADGLGWGAIANGGVSGNSQITKAGRVARLVRLVRLVRLYRIATEKRAKAEKEQELMEMVQFGEIEYVDVEKYRLLYESRSSKIGTLLSAAITRKVIVLVLVILIILPLIQYTVVDNGPQFMTHYLENVLLDQAFTDTAKLGVIDSFVGIFSHGSTGSLLVSLEAHPNVPGYVIRHSSALNYLRTSSMVNYHYSLAVAGSHALVNVSAIFSYNDAVRKSAEFSIILIIFIGMLLVLGSVVITTDAQTLVITPIERMMNLVEAVSKDPLTPLEFTQFEDGANSAGQYETKLLENTVEKITGLLRVGFGEAGGGIIKMNLDLSNTTSSINPLIEGVRVYAIVGFCDIHNFEEVNRRLKQDVLTFVNSIAEIVHSSVAYWGGQCNKNLGNAFVIIWRIGDEDSLLASTLGVKSRSTRMLTRDSDDGRSSPGRSSVRSDNRSSPLPDRHSIVNRDDETDSRIARRKAAGHVIDLKKVPGIDMIADQALIGYLKIIAELNRNDTVLQYRSNLLLTDGGKEEYKVRMGFGLHAGWAIEGAVGSIFKVDATYLSPHVNMAARLETSSRQYGVPLLASHFMHELMSSEAQSKCRKLDVVTVKGSEVPIGIYTYDCLQDQSFYSRSSLPFNLSYHTADEVQRPRRLSFSPRKSGKGPPLFFPPGSPRAKGRTIPSPVQSAPRGTPPNMHSGSGVESEIDAVVSGHGDHKAVNSTSQESNDLAHALASTAQQPLDLQSVIVNTPPQSRSSFTVVTSGTPDIDPEISSIVDHNIRTPDRDVHTGFGASSPSGSSVKFSLVMPTDDVDAHLSEPAAIPADVVSYADYSAVNQADPAEVFEKDSDLQQLRAHITIEFSQAFDSGVAQYLAGQWSLARTYLEKSNELMAAAVPSLGGDGPSLTLLSYMEERNWTAPGDWQGYRPLTSK